MMGARSLFSLFLSLSLLTAARIWQRAQREQSKNSNFFACCCCCCCLLFLNFRRPAAAAKFSMSLLLLLLLLLHQVGCEFEFEVRFGPANSVGSGSICSLLLLLLLARSIARLCNRRRLQNATLLLLLLLSVRRPRARFKFIGCESQKLAGFSSKVDRRA